MAQDGHKTAFVFAGGGSLGAIQVGVLRELVRAGIAPDLLVGASVGALNACYFAGRPDAAGVAALDAIWRSLRRQDVFPVTLKGALSWLRAAESLFDADSLRRLIERHMPFTRLEDAAVPVHVVATNLSGAPVCLSRGPVVDAVMASAAIPIALPSVKIGDEHLMDGAIAGNTPILTAAELGATRIVVLQTGYACSLDGPPGGAIARGLHALTLLISNQMERDLQLLAGKVDVYVAPHLCPLDVSPLNFGRAGELIERAGETTRHWLANGGFAHAAQPGAFAHDHAGMAMAPPAAGGFDLVSYFSGDGPPLAGSAMIAVTHEGRTYRFATPENRDAFVAAPEAYLPRYGGLCAFAMARGAARAGDPAVYRVVEGRLYFNLDAGVQTKWDGDAPGHIARADAHWRTRTAGD
ncbi:MAG: patatin-like phospholipase family protein [Hyphomonadaceae bacterium]|nr:patatin-like phospholipase family protein [Hyphomonadaceae bacterium]